MKVLFVFFTDPPRAFSSSVAALSAVVRAAGHDVEALEVSVKGGVADAARSICEAGADLVAVSAMTRDWPGASAVLNQVPPGVFVVVGGYHATFAPRDVATNPRVDAICIGEGERPLRSLLGAIERRKLDPIAGLWLRDVDGFPGEPPDADPEPDIARLPNWDYDVFGDMRQILRVGINTFGPHVDAYLPVRASRGCPFRCAYCSAPAWHRAGNYGDQSMRHLRPVGDLTRELASLCERYQPEGFEFWDEHFPISVDWLQEFAERFPVEVGLPFKVEMHPNAATRERLELLLKAGCSLFHCGVEAGDEDFRRNVLQRRTRDRDLERVFDDCRALGLPTSASLMTMLPGERREQTLATTALLRKLRPGSFMWSTYQPLPGTPLGDAAVANWPGPAASTLDDHPGYPSRTPADVSAEEREDTFRELATYQAELVREASVAAGHRPRPVDIPETGQRATPELAELLGVSLGQGSGLRLLSAVWQQGGLTLELAAPGLEQAQVTLRAKDGSPCYKATSHLSIAYRGKQAPPPLLGLLEHLAGRLGAVALDDLARAFPESGH
ncbi:MAG: cobalamin-dependent protein [Polyangiaceae bacterium]